MTTTEKELNKKIAIFAGWRKDDFGWWLTESAYNEITGKHRKTPPDFTHSLDACIEHLGPKFDNINIQKFNGMWQVGVKKICGRWCIAGGEDTPALAFCKAVGKVE